jgi:hypothetical protein
MYIERQQKYSVSKQFYINLIKIKSMKNTIILSALLFSAFALGQVGVNTENPQGSFHIDGAKDNPATGTPSVAQQANDVNIDAAGNLGIGTITPTTKVDIIKTTAGAVKITDGTQAANKIFISDAEGTGTWQDTSPAEAIQSTAGTVVNVGTAVTYTGASATVTIPGYYVISPRFIGNKAPNGCGVYVAYNLSMSQTSLVNPAYELEAHFRPGNGPYDFMYSSSVAYLDAGTYYMLVRRGGGCTSYVSRNNIGQNGFTLVLLK